MNARGEMTLSQRWNLAIFSVLALGMAAVGVLISLGVGTSSNLSAVTRLLSSAPFFIVPILVLVALRGSLLDAINGRCVLVDAPVDDKEVRRSVRYAPIYYVSWAGRRHRVMSYDTYERLVPFRTQTLCVAPRTGWVLSVVDGDEQASRDTPVANAHPVEQGTLF